MAKGAVDMDSEFCLYTVGLGSKDRMNLVIDEADLVLFSLILRISARRVRLCVLI